MEGVIIDCFGCHSCRRNSIFRALGKALVLTLYRRMGDAVNRGFVNEALRGTVSLVAGHICDVSSKGSRRNSLFDVLE